MEESGDDFDPTRADLFEALGHPNRVRILQAMETGPLGFAELKRQVGIESSGHLTFHLGKLGGLISLGSDGRYGLTDDGREALRMVRTAREWNDNTTHHRRPMEVRRALITGAVIAIVVLAAMAGIQQLRIMQLTASPPGTVELAGRSFWEASLPLSELPSSSNFTFIFHGVTFTFGSTLFSGSSGNFAVRITAQGANGTTLQSGVPITICAVPAGGEFQQGKAAVTFVFGTGVAYAVTFPDGVTEHGVLSQFSTCSSPASTGTSQTTTWFSIHTNPQVAVEESSGMITMYVSA